MTLRSEEASLVYLVSDVITSLGGTFGYGQRLYRDLKVSFAVLVLEIQNADILLAFSEKPKLWRSFEQMSRTLDKAFCDDFLNAKYEQLQAEVEKQPPPASSWWNRFFTGWTDTEQECVNSSTIESYPSLGIARDLLHSPLQRDLGITELLTGDHRVIKELTSLMNSLAESLDSCQLIETDEDPNDEAYPNPLISEAAMCGESSIRHLSQTLYHTLHDNWPCQLEGHDHGGKLGHCVEAKFCLDPQWMARDPDPSRDSFFVILAGSGLIQECRIRWNTIEAENETDILACLVDYEDSKDVCLELTRDGDNRLWGLELGQPLEVLQLEGEYVCKSLESLRDLLEIVKPTYAAKRVLGLILARSILHLLEGPWINWSLSIDDISLFCKNQDGHPYPLFDRIFLSTFFEAVDGECSPEDNRRPPYSTHPFPTIQALGIALAEIELGDELSDIYSYTSLAGLKGKPASLAKALWEECERRFHLQTGLMRTIKFCTDRASFLQFVSKRKGNVSADPKFVEVYYMKVIRPLEEDLVNGAKWTWDEVNWLQRRDLTNQGVCKIITRLKNDVTLDDSSRSSKGKQPEKIVQHSGPASSTLSFTESNHSRDISIGGSSSKTTPQLSPQANNDQQSRAQEPSRPKTRDDFGIAIICALPLEAQAVLSSFDHHWDRDTFRKAENDPNFYSVGAINGRNVVLVHPPRMGKASAANVATACAMSFTRVTLALVVGVCGGLPFKSNNEEVLLGDVIISKGVVQYDHGRQYSDGFKRKIDMEASLGRPNSQIGSVLAALETQFHRDKTQHRITTFLDDLGEDKTYYPGHVEDRLFPSSYRHKHHDRQACSVCADCQNGNGLVCDAAPELSCQLTGCEDTRLVKNRKQNQRNRPSVHVGLMASGDSVLKSATHRDEIAEKENVIGFEMEGAGAWDALPCVVIKSVCDYADSHKNKIWQKYAAITAAAGAKAFIQYW